jgi:7-keto-8-aminopelargonate synthetase-like enzyme
VQSNEGKARRDSLWRRVGQFNPKSTSAIIPIILGDETRAVELAAKLRSNNIFIPAIRYPTVARGQARLRVTLTAAHTAEDVAELLATLKTLNQ